MLKSQLPDTDKNQLLFDSFKFDVNYFLLYMLISPLLQFLSGWEKNKILTLTIIKYSNRDIRCSQCNIMTAVVCVRHTLFVCMCYTKAMNVPSFSSGILPIGTIHSS